MSFSAETKNELCKLKTDKKCCAVAESYGALLYAQTFSQREIRIVTASPDFAARLPRLFRRAFGVDFDRLPEPGRAGKSSLVITDAGKTGRIFAQYGLDAGSTLVHHINLAVLENDCCRASFLRGAFLAGGSITDPDKRYHLELVTGHASVSRETYSILLELGFSPKDTTRKGSFITYLKQSAAIEDFLTTIGAPVASMGIMQAKVEKDMRNAVNRKVNCDSANADKTVTAAQEQLSALRRIDKFGPGLSELPEKLQQTALLRIANPESSIADLAALSFPPVSKSCVGHRLAKLMALAETLPEE